MNFANRMQIIQKIMKADKLLTAYCVQTNMPLVDCSSETFNDRAFAFENEELLKVFARQYQERKLAIKGIIFPAKEKMRFFATLLSINVDELIYIDKTGPYIIKLSDFIKKQDMSKIPEAARPVENPGLQLSGIYFMQEAARPVPAEQKENLKELEEELAANMVKSMYLMPVEISPAPSAGNDPETDPDGRPRPVQIKIPLIRDLNGDTYQPLFTDNIELSRFLKQQKPKVIKVPFALLEKNLAKEAKGYMINPNGFHIKLPRELLKGLRIRFDVPDVPDMKK